MRRALAILVGSIVSGAMLHWALPPHSWWFFGCIAFVPLLVAVQGTSFIVGFLGGLLAVGTTAYLGIQGWGYAHLYPEGSPYWVSIGCALFGFASSIVAGLAAEKKAAPSWRLAAVAVLLEACLLIYLPATLALTQSRQPLALMVASVGGVWAVAYLVWLANLGIASLLSRRPGWALATGAAIAGATAAANSLWSPVRGPSRAIVLVQSADVEADRLGMMSGTDPRTLAVWPEFAGLALAPEGDTRELRELSAQGSAIVTTFQDGAGALPHNAAALFAEGSESPRYFKRKLFGGEVNMHTAGDRAVAVPWRGTTVGLNVCFDSCYPAIVRETAKRGAGMIALPTIDPPSSNHWLAAMHAAYTPFRAAETGVPIVRADGNAYSMVVDGRGNVVAELEPGEASTEVSVPLGPGATFYRLTGDWVLYACGVGLFAPAAYRARRRRMNLKGSA